MVSKLLWACWASAPAFPAVRLVPWKQVPPLNSSSNIWVVQLHLPGQKPSLADKAASYSQPRIHLLLRATELLSSGYLLEKPTNVRGKSRLLGWVLVSFGSVPHSPAVAASHMIMLIILCRSWESKLLNKHSYLLTISATNKGHLEPPDKISMV